MILAHLPDYFNTTRWKNPNNAYDDLFQYAMRTKLHNFEVLASQAYYQQAFNTMISLPYRRAERAGLNSSLWRRSCRVQKDTDALLVDIGGGQRREVSPSTKVPQYPRQTDSAGFTCCHWWNSKHPCDYWSPGPWLLPGAAREERKGILNLRIVLHDWSDK